MTEEIGQELVDFPFWPKEAKEAWCWVLDDKMQLPGKSNWKPHMYEEAGQGDGIVPILTQSSTRRLSAGPWLANCSPRANPLRITCDQ